MSSGDPSDKSCAKAREHNAKPARLPGPPWLSFLLLIVCSTCGLHLTPAQELRPQAQSDSTWTGNARTKRPVGETDSIQMVRLGDPLYEDGAPSKGIVAKFSPDGSRFVVVLRRGDLNTNTNEYSLILFKTNEAFRSPHPRRLLSMMSSSNRPAIEDVVWLQDNDTILFLGQGPNETSQLYSLKCNSNELKKLTDYPNNLTSFVATMSGEEVILAGESPEQSFTNEYNARKGFTVTSESLDELIAGKHAKGEHEELLVEQVSDHSVTKISTEGRVESYNDMSLSPDGRYLVLKTEALKVPSLWSQYEDQYLKATRPSTSALGARTLVWQYELVDTRTGIGQLLVDAPIPSLGGSEFAWSPDSQSLVISNMYLPLDIEDTAERARRKTHTFLVELKIPSRNLVKISDQDLRLLDWDAKTNDVVCDTGRLNSFAGKTTARVYFRRSSGGDHTSWSSSGNPLLQEKVVALPDIVLDESMSRPPRIFAISPDSREKSLLIDLNPQFQNLTFAKVEEVSWKTPTHQDVKGGLYWPVDYIFGMKYPLVIQTHAWSPDRFWIDGPWTTAFAAQALAGKGFFVLQVSDTDWRLIDTPKEVPAAMAVYDGAIDFLDHKGLIDRDRVGIIGFSRTYLYVTYALVHSKHHFAAAAVADGVDYSYFQYMLAANADQRLASVFDSLNGAPPFGRGLLKWLRVSPAFLMDRIKTPFRIQTLGPGSLMADWHWFSGLTSLGKPVEMVYIADGAHILEKPWDRAISQQGNVDWFCFWLKGEEDPDPEKAEQYSRWRKLRAVAAAPLESRALRREN
jgi:hypothetical protein